MWSCSLHKGHFGDHVAYQNHDLRNLVLMIWKDEEEVEIARNNYKAMRR